MAAWGIVNTCDTAPFATISTAITSATGTDIETLVCAGDESYCTGVSPVTGTKATSCSHNYFTCMTCDASGTIQVQTNNMPNRCWEHNTTSPNVAGAVAVDFTVTFNKSMTSISNYDFDDFIDSADVDLLLCNISRTNKSNMHISISYTDADGSTDTSTWSGVSNMNIGIFNGLASGNTDAMQAEATTMDQCLTHAAPTTNALHVHSVSPCGTTAAAASSPSTKPGVCTATGVDCTATTFWYNNWTKPSDGLNGGIYGLARDGHIIYGPYNTSNELWSCDDLDPCNGWWPDFASGEYAYAATTFFPYTVGCWGPVGTGSATSPTDVTVPAAPTCSSNACPSGGLSGINFSYLIAAGLALFNVLF